MKTRIYKTAESSTAKKSVAETWPMCTFMINIDFADVGNC